MSNSIYLVVGSGGQYYYAWTSNLIATFDKTVAEKYIADEPIRKNLWKKHRNKFNGMTDDWSELYQKKNPTPVWEGQHSSPAQLLNSGVKQGMKPMRFIRFSLLRALV